MGPGGILSRTAKGGDWHLGREGKGREERGFHILEEGGRSEGRRGGIMV